MMCNDHFREMACDKTKSLHLGQHKKGRRKIIRYILAIYMTMNMTMNMNIKEKYCFMVNLFKTLYPFLMKYNALYLQTIMISFCIFTVHIYLIFMFFYKTVLLITNYSIQNG